MAVNAGDVRIMFTLRVECGPDTPISEIPKWGDMMDVPAATVGAFASQREFWNAIAPLAAERFRALLVDAALRAELKLNEKPGESVLVARGVSEPVLDKE